MCSRALIYLFFLSRVNSWPTSSQPHFKQGHFIHTLITTIVISDICMLFCIKLHHRVFKVVNVLKAMYCKNLLVNGDNDAPRFGMIFAPALNTNVDNLSNNVMHPDSHPSHKLLPTPLLAQTRQSHIYYACFLPVWHCLPFTCTTTTHTPSLTSQRRRNTHAHINQPCKCN